MMLFFLLLGLVVVDTDLALQKKQEVKTLLELANHDATWAIDQALKTEGIIDLVETEAISRFDRRMEQNGRYRRQGAVFIPAQKSVTTDQIAILHYYIDFTQWRKNTQLSLTYRGDKLVVDNVAIDSQVQPSGGVLQITVTTESAERLTLAPKRMIGPSLVAVGYVDEQPLFQLLPGHSFPVVSVEELKW
ncbi:hypothetical protein [Brevibacillus fluminis]